MTLRKFGSNTQKKSLNKFGSTSTPGGKKEAASAGKKKAPVSRSKRPSKATSSSVATSPSIEPKFLPTSVKMGDTLKVTWESGGNKMAFSGELVDVRKKESGDYFTIRDSSHVYFHYPVYLCDSVKKVR